MNVSRIFLSSENFFFLSKLLVRLRLVGVEGGFGFGSVGLIDLGELIV
jgi:hypothetical protein